MIKNEVVKDCKVMLERDVVKSYVFDFQDIDIKKETEKVNVEDKIKEEKMDFEDEDIFLEKNSDCEEKSQIIKQNDALIARMPNISEMTASKLEIKNESIKHICDIADDDDIHLRFNFKCTHDEGENNGTSCIKNNAEQSNLFTTTSSSCSKSDSGSSLVWKYFEKMSGEKAKCQLCHNSYSRKRGSTSGLMNHLRSMHKSNYKRLVDDEAKRILLEQKMQWKKAAMQKVKLETKPIASLTSGIAKDSSKFIDFRISEMICLDDLPFNFVEGQGFVHFVSKVLPDYKLKGHNFYSQLVGKHIYEFVFKFLKLLIKNTRHKLSLTIDDWSKLSACTSLLSFTCHGITEDFQRTRIVLCAKPLFDTKASEHITEKFNELMSSWDIPISKVHAVVVTELGPNRKNAFKLADVSVYDCAAHKLHLVVMAGIKAQRKVQDIISKCQFIAAHFNNSVVAQEELKKQQIRLNQPNLCLLQDVSTQWNSTFYMLKRILEIREPLCLFLSSEAAVSLPHLNSNEWTILQRCIDALDPFEQVTRKLCEPSASISDVIPMISLLRSFCEDKNDESDSGIISMKEALRTEIKCRFSELETVQAYAVATYLDPRYKGKVFSNDEVVDQTQEEIVNMCSTLCDEQEAVVDKPQCPEREALDVKQEQIEVSKSLQARLKAMISANNRDQEREEAGLTRSQKKAKKEISIKNMIEDYDLLKNIEIDEDPLIWWRENKFRYSLLCEVAQTYLACPPASVPMEQSFILNTPQRHYHKEENAEKLLFLKYNLPLIKFEYEI